MFSTTTRAVTAALSCLLLSACDGDPGEQDSPVDTHDPAAVQSCEGPVDIELSYGGASGYQACDDGSVNRVSAVDLDPEQYADRVTECPEDISPNDGNCSSDADCGDDAQHQCGYISTYYVYGCFCEFLCSSDADCAEGQICVAPEAANGVQWPTCVVAECTGSSDCASGECGVSSKGSECGDWVRLDCRTEDDTCRANSDCTEDQDNLCTARDGESTWACSTWYGCD